MSTTTRVGLLGTGFIGQVHAKNLAAHDQIDLKTICDTNEALGRKVAGQVGAAFVPDAAAVIEDDQIDVVWIASSANTHGALIRQALAAGKAVFCEKPVAVDVDDARALVAESAKYAQPTFIGFNRRFDPTHRRLKEHVLAGHVGTPEVVALTSRDPNPPPPDYVAATPGGLFYDTMIHDFDMALWLLDELPTEIYAVASNCIDASLNPHHDLDTAAVMMRTKSGKLCQINASRRATYGYDQRVEVLGSKGMVQSGNQGPNTATLSIGGAISRDPLKNFFIDRYTQAYVDEIDSFLSVLTGEEKDYPDLKAGYDALRLSMVALESAQSGRPITLET